MKSPLSDALQKRRKVELPQEEAPQLDVNAVVQSLAPEIKQQLFEALKADMGSQSQVQSYDDEGADPVQTPQGELKSSSGEKAALNQGMDMDLASELQDPRMTGDEDPSGKGLGDRMRINIAKMFNKRG
jgi:hypothetical protein